MPVPFISVVIPTNRQPQLLPSSIGSALAGMRGDVEVIVVPNGPDQSWRESLAPFAADGRIRVEPIATPHANAARALSECTIVNGMFRRKYLDGFAIKPVEALDKVPLSHLLFFGELEYPPSATYRCRFIPVRASTLAERISGSSSTSGMDAESLVAYFASDLKFNLVNEDSSRISRWRTQLILKVLAVRFLRPSGRYIRLLCTLQVQPARSMRALLQRISPYRLFRSWFEPRGMR